MAKKEVSSKELSAVMPILERLVYADKATRAKLQKRGVNILPCNFYSSTPSIAEVENSFEYVGKEAPYLVGGLFNEKRFGEELARLGEFAVEFDPPVEGDEKTCTEFFWGNSQFSYSDAMAYYCYTRLLRPKRIVEIGSGFSTLVALAAMAKNGAGSITCIEPFPRKFLTRNKDVDLQRITAQAVKAEYLNDTLQDGDILFIDSTHTVKSGSDCVHIYLRLLPEIRRRIHVHVHDIFLPHGLPQEWLLNEQIFWTEQYLLLALLHDNPRTELFYGSNFNAHQHPEQMAKFMGGKNLSGGSSVWFTYN